jgi:hypothetical protein
VTWGFAGVPVPGSVGPGQNVTFNFNIKGELCSKLPHLRGQEGTSWSTSLQTGVFNEPTDRYIPLHLL